MILHSLLRLKVGLRLTDYMPAVFEQAHQRTEFKSKIMVPSCQVPPTDSESHY